MPKLTNVLNKVGKTINLAKSNSYQIPRKPPLNSLIFEKLPESRCGERITMSINSPPVTKPVRICTREDIQTSFCPPPCDCKIKPRPLTFSQKLGFLLKQSLKGLIVGGLVYATYHQGIWSDGFRSACFLGKIYEICPEEDDNINELQDLSSLTFDDPQECQPYIPHAGYILYKMGYWWNQGVIFFFWLLLDGLRALWRLLMSFTEPKKPEIVDCCEPVESI